MSAGLCKGSCFFVRAQPFLSFPYVSIISRHQSRYMIEKVYVIHGAIDNDQAEMHTWPPDDFCGFCLEHAVTHTPDLLTLPIELKCHTMVEWSQFITFASSRIQYTDVGHCWLMFKRSSSNPEGLPGCGVSLMSKLSFSKRENHFYAVLSQMALPITTQMFLAASAAFVPLLNSKRRSEMFQFLHFELHFLASTAPLTIFKWQNFICKLKHNWTYKKWNR